MSSEQEYDASRFNEALQAMQNTISQFNKSSEQERRALNQEFSDLLGMSSKLETGRVDIIVFGEISSGKSSLINALVGKKVADADVRGGWTKDVGNFEWDKLGYKVVGFDSSQVLLVDTPGINEVSGESRAKMARTAAQRADLILFVTDSDLNDTEFAYLSDLATHNKPTILVFNKLDLYDTEQRKRLNAVLVERVTQLIVPQNVVQTSADPMEKEYIIEHPDGREEIQIRKPPPNIINLKQRILEVLDKEGKALIALNSMLFAADTNDKIVSTRVRLRDEKAQTTIIGFAVTKGVAVVVNLVPVADIAGGVVVDTAMVGTLAALYGLQMTQKNIWELVWSIIKSAGFVTIGEWITTLVTDAVNIVTLGVTIPVTALPQGVSAAYGSYVVGNAAKYYLEHGGSWGDKGPKKVVEEILTSADKESVLEMLRDRIVEQVAVNQHATAKTG